MSKIHLKLMNIQQSLVCLKGQYSEFGKYSYRKAEDILSAVKPFLKENSCILLLSDEIELVGDRFYIKATATLVCTETGEEIKVSAYAREDLTRVKMDVSQLTGVSSSYARKISMSGLFGLDNNKDADELDNTKLSAKKTDENPLAPKNMILAMESKISALQLVEKEILEYCKVEKKKMTVIDFTTVMNVLEKIEQKRKVKENE
jgi:hypothetical protein